MKISVLGCGGRMGQMLIREVQSDHQVQLAGGLVRSQSQLKGMDLGELAGIGAVGVNASTHLQGLCDISDAIIDFTNPATTLEVAQYVKNTRIIHIIGTTGLTVAEENQLAGFAASNVMVWSANMSIGLNVILSLVEKMAAVLDDRYDIEVLEMHHCHKRDAPSGTALALGRAAAKGRNVALEQVACYARQGMVGARPQGEIGFATLRGGDIVGEHQVMLAGDGERITLGHQAFSRSIFAKGAIKAALWAKNKAPGLYTMQDVLFSSV